jgi:hypothetical protein
MKDFEAKDFWVNKSPQDNITVSIRTSDDLIYRFKGISEGQLGQEIYPLVIHYLKNLDEKPIKTTNVSCAGLTAISEEELDRYATTLNPFIKFLNRKPRTNIPGIFIRKIDPKSQTIEISILDTDEGRDVEKWLGEDRIKFSYNPTIKTFEYEVLV